MSRALRVAVGGLSHETNTFTPVATTAEDFNWWHAAGDDLLRFAGTNSPLGGFLHGAAELGLEVVPTWHAEALPSGPLARSEFDLLLGQLLESLAAVLPIDGVLLDLHGAMAAEGYDDCDGEILRRVRELVGDSVRIVVQLDIHANLSALMMRHADLLVGRRTYPEIDMDERGRDCAALLARLCREDLSPSVALRRLPLIWGTAQATAHGEMAELMRRLDAVLAEPDVLTACVLTGFPWVDSPSMGSTIYVATAAKDGRAELFADELADFVLARREHWYEQLPDTRAAIHAARAVGRYPVVLADFLDNPGSGAPGDGTGMLRAFLDEGLDDACLLYIVDEGSVRRCEEAGVGATVRLELGGHAAAAQGPPVEVDATVRALSDGRFTYTNLYAGLDSSMGPSALVRTGGVDVVLVTNREQPFGPEFAESLGVDMGAMRWIGVKSMQHFRAGFEPIAGQIQLVQEPNVNGPERGYTRRRVPLYPLDPVVATRLPAPRPGSVKEAHAAVDPADPRRAAVAAMHPVDGPRVGRSILCWRTEDGGATWEEGRVEQAKFDDEGAADPLVAYGADGALLSVSMNLSQAFRDGHYTWAYTRETAPSIEELVQAYSETPERLFPRTDIICLARSEDGGRTWTSVVVPNSVDADKTAMAVDHSGVSPFRGYVYMAWNDTANGQIAFARSVDGGRTVEPAIRVAGRNGSNMVQLAVGPDGVVHLLWHLCFAVRDDAEDPDVATGIFHARSLDGGATFSEPVVVAHHGGIARVGVVSVAAAPSGALLAVWSEAVAPAHDRLTQPRHVLRWIHSADGVRWSEPQAVGEAPEGGGQGLPAVAATDRGWHVLCYEAGPDAASVCIYSADQTELVFRRHCTLASRDIGVDDIYLHGSYSLRLSDDIAQVGDYAGLAGAGERLVAAFVLPVDDDREGRLTAYSAVVDMSD